MRRFATAAIVATAILAFPQSAPAAGGPPISVGATGVPVPSGHSAFETIHSRGRTVVLQVRPGSGRVVDYGDFPGDFGVPSVGLDRPTPTGLSADGHTLVLAESRFPTKRTSFAVVNTNGPGLGRIVSLKGRFGVDGVSPDGEHVYLVQYFKSPYKYAVRRYDLSAHRLARDAIVDPSDDEQMRGFPVTRVASPNGHWDYTLYSGATAGKSPFIHALDVAHGKAKCIDLPRSLGNPIQDRLRVSGDGSTIVVSRPQRGTLAAVDTSTFEISTPGSADRAGASSSADGLPWVLIALGGVIVVVLASWWGMPRIRQRRLAGDS
jgi:hypothetical protein